MRRLSDTERLNLLKMVSLRVVLTDPSYGEACECSAISLRPKYACRQNSTCATGEIDCSTSSPPGCAQHLSKDGGPENAAAPQSMQPPPPVALPPGGAPVAQPGQNRLPHPMDPLPRLNMHACCSPALWAPPAAHMQHPAPPRYPYMMPASSIPMWTGPPGMKGMQEPPVPALQNTDSCRELEQKSGVKHAPTRIGAPAPPRPPLLLAAALGRTDVVQILLAGTDYCEPPQPFTDHRYFGQQPDLSAQAWQLRFLHSDCAESEHMAVVVMCLMVLQLHADQLAAALSQVHRDASGFGGGSRRRS